MAAAFGDLAGIIGRTPGLRWKIWTENEDEGTGAASTSSRTTSRRSRTSRSTPRGSRASAQRRSRELFHVNEPLTATQRRSGLSGQPSLELGASRPAPALQVRGADARLVLGHGCPGRRLLRPLPALLRPTRERSTTVTSAVWAWTARVRDARFERRVPRAGPLRRPPRVLRSACSRLPRTSATYGCVAVRRPETRFSWCTATQTRRPPVERSRSRRPRPDPRPGPRAAIPRLRGRRPRPSEPRETPFSMMERASLAPCERPVEWRPRLGLPGCDRHGSRPRRKARIRARRACPVPIRLYGTRPPSSLVQVIRSPERGTHPPCRFDPSNEGRGSYRRA
jgi:hypothetical protein